MSFQVKVLTEQAQALLDLTSTLERDNRLLKQRAAAGRYALRFTQLLSSSITNHRADTTTVESILRTQHSKAAVLHQLEEQIHLLTQLAPGITHLPLEGSWPEDLRTGSNTSTSSSNGSSSTAAVQGGDGSTQSTGPQEGSAPVLAFLMDPVQFFKAALEHYDWAATTYDIDLAAARVMHTTLRSSLSSHLQQFSSADTPEAAAAATTRLLDTLARFWATVGQGAVLAPQVIYQVCTLNLDTGLPDTPSPQHLAQVTHSMHMTQEQKQQVADLLVAHQALQRPHLQQRQQLQQLIAVCGSSMRSVVDPSASGAATAAPQQQPLEAGGIPRSSSGSVQISPEYTLQLAQQLDSTMKKLAWLEHCFATLLLCTLGLHKFACWAVGMHPHPLRCVVWAAHVAESLKEGPAQQQQQQQQVERHMQLPPPVPPQFRHQHQQQQQQAPEPPASRAPPGLPPYVVHQAVVREQLPWARCTPSGCPPLQVLPVFAPNAPGSGPQPPLARPANRHQEPPGQPHTRRAAPLYGAPITTGAVAALNQTLAPAYAAAGQAAGPAVQQERQGQEQQREQGRLAAGFAQEVRLPPLYPVLGSAAAPASAAATALEQEGELEPQLAGLLCELDCVLTSDGAPSQLDLVLGLDLADAHTWQS